MIIQICISCHFARYTNGPGGLPENGALIEGKLRAKHCMPRQTKSGPRRLSTPPRPPYLDIGTWSSSGSPSEVLSTEAGCWMLEFGAPPAKLYDRSTTPLYKHTRIILSNFANLKTRTRWLNVFCDGLTTSTSIKRNLFAVPYHLTTNSPYIPPAQFFVLVLLFLDPTHHFPRSLCLPTVVL